MCLCVSVSARACVCSGLASTLAPPDTPSAPKAPLKGSLQRHVLMWGVSLRLACVRVSQWREGPYSGLTLMLRGDLVKEGEAATPRCRWGCVCVCVKGGGVGVGCVWGQCESRTWGYYPLLLLPHHPFPWQQLSLLQIQLGSQPDPLPQGCLGLCPARGQDRDRLMLVIFHSSDCLVRNEPNFIMISPTNKTK